MEREVTELRARARVFITRCLSPIHLLVFLYLFRNMENVFFSEMNFRYLFDFQVRFTS